MPTVDWLRKGDMSLPLSTVREEDYLTFVRVAREIAINHFPLETILDRYEISTERWQTMQALPLFKNILESEIADWQSAGNTHERTKLKAAALVEEWLPEANTRIHDETENLNAKTELGKLLARIAGMGLTGAGIEGGGSEKFSVTINLGEDKQLKFQKELPSKVIDSEAVEL